MADEKPTLDYDPMDPPQRIAAWTWAVFGLYVCLIIAVLAAPFVALNESGSNALLLQVLFSAGMLLAGLLMVIVPVRAKLRRPIRRRSVWLPIVGSSLLIALLAFAVLMAADDAFPNKVTDGPYWSILGVWLVWMVVLGLLARKSNPVAMSARIYKAVLVGSLLELLTAVPLHLIARRRTECCAGVASGIAIALGIMVAIVAIGPGIFFLFYRRWKLHYGVKRDRPVTAPLAIPPAAPPMDPTLLDSRDPGGTTSP